MCKNYLRKMTQRVYIIFAFSMMSCGTNSSQSTLSDPSFDFTETSGCGDLVAYAKNPSYTEILVIAASRTKLGLSTTETSFDLSETREGLEVYAQQNRNDIDEAKRFSVCDDQIFPDAPKPKKWIAIEGRLKIKISNDTPRPGLEKYKIDFRLEKVKFKDSTSETVKKIDEIEFKETNVGWFPG